MAAAEVDWEHEGLLDGVPPERRPGRVKLLERLLADGFRMEELSAAAADGTLTALPTLLELGGPARFTARESAAAAGLDLGFVLDVRRANGVPVADPDAPALSEADLAIGGLTKAATDAGVTAEQVLETSRVLGHTLRQVADNFSEVVFELAYEPGLDEAALAERFATQVAAFQPLIDQLLANGLRVHFRDAVRDAAIAAAEQTARGGLSAGRDVTVAFADLVGFTRLGEELPPAGLERVAARLTELAQSVTDAPVRLVKSIGDAVMLASPTPGPLVEAMLELSELADAEGQGFPQLRIGIASGQAMTRGGDWYGRPVNLASRLTAIARGGSVLTTSDVRDALRDEFHWSAAGPRRIRGVQGTVPVYRARARGYDAEAGAAA
jgi:adenylate cyclase